MKFSKIKPTFNAGKSVFDSPEDKVNVVGTVPVSYARDINNRKDILAKIERDFKEHNKTMEEFDKMQNKRFLEAASQPAALARSISQRAEKLADDIANFLESLNEYKDFHTYISTEEFETLDKAGDILYRLAQDFGTPAIKEQLKESFPTTIDLDRVVIDVANMLNVDKLGEDEWIEIFPTRDSYPLTNGEYVQPLALEGPRDQNLKASFESKNGKIIVKFATSGNEKECNNTEEIAAFVAEQFGVTLTEEALHEAVVTPEVDEEEEEKTTTAKKRHRSKNVKDEDKLYSTDDLWLQVYDDLSAEVRNQKPGTDVSKNVILKRGETYAGPYAGPGDYDLHVKARTMDDLAGAKKVAEYYGVKLDIQPNTDSTKNYYKYVGIFRDLR